MPKKRYTPEEIIQHLRTVELETGKGLAVLDAPKGLRNVPTDCLYPCHHGVAGMPIRPVCIEGQSSAPGPWRFPTDSVTYFLSSFVNFVPANDRLYINPF